MAKPIEATPLMDAEEFEKFEKEFKAKENTPVDKNLVWLGKKVINNVKFI